VVDVEAVVYVVVVGSIDMIVTVDVVVCGVKVLVIS